MDEKECSKCGKVKPIDEFNNHNGTKDGKNPQCKKCQSKYNHNYWKKRKNIEMERIYNSGSFIMNAF